MELKELKSGLSAAVEKYNGKQVGVGEVRIDFMAHDCFNTIVDLEKEISALKSERDVAVRALKIACENECSGIGFDMMGCPPHGEDCKQCGDKVKCWTDYYIQQAKEDFKK